ncbi:MAG: type I secretion system permease/ATPase [Pseudomonadota bacterium]
MHNDSHQLRAGRAELKEALRSGRSLFYAVGLFSFFVNLLMLTGPIFMLQVYDRVLSSRSESTLVALFVFVTGLFLMMGLLDFIRARVLARAGARFQSILDARVFTATLTRSIAPTERSRPASGLRDLESIQRVLSGPAPFAVFDAPWVPIYLGAIFLFHPWLGYLALMGAVILVILTIMNEYASKEPQRKAVEAQMMAETFENAARREAETLKALGMRDNAVARWRRRRDAALEAQITASDRTGSYTATSKTMRFWLQSGMLALGAYLVLLQQVSPGVMIAASILMGRALAPIEQAIGQWAGLQRARQGWRSLTELLARTPAPEERTQLPDPKGRLAARALTAGPPGERTPLLRNLSFMVAPGEALGVIGPSGAGKSSLARVLAGIWPPMAGELRLDGATLDQWDSDVLGRSMGYLPQDVALMDGTIAENIARLDAMPDPRDVIEAAKRAGAHDIILGLPKGYDTPIGIGGAQLSGGQRQRIALARALYGDPALVILDEPNANLDAEGEQALLGAIRDLKDRGKSVVIIAHRPSAIAACDKILMLDKGQQRAFGPKDEVLKQTTLNYPQLVKKDGGAVQDQGGAAAPGHGAGAGTDGGAAPQRQPAQQPQLRAQAGSGRPPASKPGPATGSGRARSAPQMSLSAELGPQGPDPKKP